MGFFDRFSRKRKPPEAAGQGMPMMITSDTLRDLSRTFAEAMGKTVNPTGLSYMEMGADQTVLHFECTDGCYRANVGADSIEIFDDEKGGTGQLVHRMKRN